MGQLFHSYGKFVSTHPFQAITVFITLYVALLSTASFGYTRISLITGQSDQFIIMMIRLCAILLTGHQISVSTNSGSKTVLRLVCIFYLLQTVLFLLGSCLLFNNTDLSRQLPILLSLIALSKPRRFILQTLTATSFDEAMTVMGNELCISTPKLSFDTLYFLVMFTFGLFSNIQGVQALSALAIFALFVNYTTFTTLFPACFSVWLKVFDFNEKRKRRQTDHSCDNFHFKSKLQKIYLFLFVGVLSMLIDLIWPIISPAELLTTSVVLENIHKYENFIEFGLFAILYGKYLATEKGPKTSKDEIGEDVLVEGEREEDGGDEQDNICDEEEDDHELDEEREDVVEPLGRKVSFGDNNVPQKRSCLKTSNQRSSNFLQVPGLSRTERRKASITLEVPSMTRTERRASESLQVPSEPRTARRASHTFELPSATRTERRASNSLEVSGMSRTDRRSSNSLEVPNMSRSERRISLLVNLFKECPEDLDDDEVLQMVEHKLIPTYGLEKALNDPERGVFIRRKLLEKRLGGHPLDGLPFENYDMSKVHGACCENVLGYVPIPVGVAGPLLLDGFEYSLPMATTEGCLVASTNRGCRVLHVSGGVHTSLLSEGMTRAPVVKFPSAMRAAEVLKWLKDEDNYILIKKYFESTSRYTNLVRVTCKLAARYLHIRFVAETGDAMGMNMVSKGAEAVLKKLSELFPDMQVLGLSGNTCSDKKPSALNWIEGRGKSVVAEAFIPGDVVRDVLKVDVQSLVELNINKNLVGSALSGSIGGFNAHASNIVTAVFLATGQDPAQNVNSSMCITILELYGDDDQDLYISCTMPSIEVGTIGGGTVLPAQGACLELLGIKGSALDDPGRNANQLARIICGAVLAGELSILSALCAGHMVKAHLQHNRKRFSVWTLPPSRCID